MPLVTQQEYNNRRQELLAQIGPNGIAIIPGGSEIFRAGDCPYPFRQNNQFYYLTGFQEPNAILVLASTLEKPVILFNQARDPKAEIWHGRRAGQQGALDEYQMDQAYPIESFSEHLPDLLLNMDKLYYPIGQNSVLEQKIIEAIRVLRSKVRSGVKLPEQFYNIDPLLNNMRLFKSEAEVATMQKAVDASVIAHERAMKICRPGLSEADIEADIRYVLAKNGCRHTAYNPIIGSGANSCILHYEENTSPLLSGDLLLVDAGGEYENYAADLTRTYPVNGKFTVEQKAIYELVLESQLAAIDLIKPGIKYFALQECIYRVLTKGLLDLGILQGNLEKLIEDKAVTAFYMHNFGHWIGLETHDVGSYKVDGQWRILEAGFVLTVEPGLYFAANNPNVDKKWWNIGVRIEDNILVTENGYRVLSGALPKTVTEIEKLMSSSK